MARRLHLVTLAALTGLAIALVLGTGDAPLDYAFHITLANPALYEGGVYADSFEVPGGHYAISFVPSGGSPAILDITITGPSVSFAERYDLVGTLQDTGISEYYTWEYDGEDTFLVEERQTLHIIIDPNGYVEGPVSVSIRGATPP